MIVRVVVVVAAVGAIGGCTQTVGGGTPDIDAARKYRRLPLYWVGERFEKWELEHVTINGEFVSFTYGTCELDVPADGGCPVPLDIQIQSLCANLNAVARAPIWKRRSIRGAPVGTIDSAPVLFTNRVQVKVYRGQGTTPGVAMRALRALRSVNDVPPVLREDDPIPPAGRAVLDGSVPCR